MDVTHGNECSTCKHAKGGYDLRVNGYRVFCNNTDVSNGDMDKPPVCGWNNKYTFYEKGERKTLSAEKAIFNFSYLYYKLKGKILSVVESQMDKGGRLDATKDVIENVLSQKEEELKEYLREVFAEWGIKK